MKVSIQCLAAAALALAMPSAAQTSPNWSSDPLQGLTLSKFVAAAPAAAPGVSRSAATGVWELPFIQSSRQIAQEKPFPQDLPCAEVLVAEPATKDSDVLPYSPDQLQAGSGTSFDFSGYPKPVLGPSNELEAEYSFFINCFLPSPSGRDARSPDGGYLGDINGLCSQASAAQSRELKITVKFPQLKIAGEDVLFRDHVVGGLNYASHNHPDNGWDDWRSIYLPSNDADWDYHYMLDFSFAPTQDGRTRVVVFMRVHPNMKITAFPRHGGKLSGPDGN